MAIARERVATRSDECYVDVVYESTGQQPVSAVEVVNRSLYPLRVLVEYPLDPYTVAFDQTFQPQQAPYVFTAAELPALAGLRWRRAAKLTDWAIQLVL
jgi:hypothetical protein